MELQTIGSIGLWSGFIIFVLMMLAIDLGVFHKKTHTVGFKEAVTWSIVWMSLAAFFGIIVWIYFGPALGMEFFTGYVIEKSLSIDNIFVFVIIFSALKIPALYQHKVLFWGIVSALVMRAGMIFAGTILLERFHWLIYVFGALLVLTGIKLFIQRNKEQHPESGWAMRMAKKLIRTTNLVHGSKFFVRENGRLLATPLFMALVLIEVTDVIFAVDSIPAIFAVTSDPFIVFTSNIFAILGLRSLYFLVSGLVEKFIYLKVGLAAILVFVGIKMGLMNLYKLPPLLSLLIIVAILAISIMASLYTLKKKQLHSQRAILEAGKTLPIAVNEVV